MQIKVKLVYQIFVTKPRRIQWRTEEAYLKSEAVAALPKLLQGLGGADFEDCFLKDAGHDRVYCFRLAPKVRLPSGSENDHDGLLETNTNWEHKLFAKYQHCIALPEFFIFATYKIS